MVTTAFIYIWGKRVGAVAWDSTQGVANFEFDTHFDSEKWQLAPFTMPQKGVIYSFPALRDSDTFKGLPGLLADSLPDRYGKELIDVWLAQQGRPSNSLNPVELLCFIGKRGMGALEFQPSLKTEDTSTPLELTSLVEYTRQLLSHKEKIKVHTNEELKDVMLDILKMGTSAGGARPKAIIAYNEKTGEIRSGQSETTTDFEHWLIKFDGVNDTQFGSSHGYGRVEMTYYKMATDFGIQMTECRLIEEEDRAHFMTKRFDRKKGNQKLHTQTFCALQHFDYNNIMSYSYEQLFQTMRQLKLSYSEAEEMYRRMVFNVLARNCDDHTKNFSFLMDTDGVWKLAPAYDICFAYHPENKWVKQHNLSINGKRSDINKQDLLIIASENSIRNPEAIINHCLEIIQNWKKYAKQYKVPKELSQKIDALLIKDIK
ncbi:MAG: type II toxin-antitoxin system HipA family toxin [Brumimicrobium sp.]|nr:type II toxin-antitoxin system HipA family toxin [Brumimicrobium sp.]